MRLIAKSYDQSLLNAFLVRCERLCKKHGAPPKQAIIAPKVIAYKIVSPSRRVQLVQARYYGRLLDFDASPSLVEELSRMTVSGSVHVKLKA